MERYIYQDGKRLRYGYTTGSCAAAAAKGAVDALYSSKFEERVEIETIAGWRLDLELLEMRIEGNIAVCAVKKDAGDDPDITNGILVYAAAEKIEPFENKEECFYNSIGNIELAGGEGVGRVTKRGLQVPPGKPAINNGPRTMIFQEVEKVLPPGENVRVKIFIPEGVEKSLKTFNPKLGITGGISVLGSTGIVKPMSEEAFKNSLAIELSVLKEERKKKTVIFIFGNYGKKFIEDYLDIPLGDVLIISNFAGFMIDQAVNLGYEKIIFLGHIGKMVKLAGGIFHTHSKVSDGKLEIFSACALLAGEERETLLQILDSNTTDEAVEYVEKKETFDIMCEKIVERCKARAGNIDFSSLIFSFENGELARSSNFDYMIRELKDS